MSQKYRFLFGAPVQPRSPLATSPKRVFVLGAYPSAIHVCWTDPDGRTLIKAIAVDNEPEPFWTGTEIGRYVQEWQSKIDWKPSWGHVTADNSINGPSGVWVSENVLQALGVTRKGVWLTDCLDTYHQSSSAKRALDRKAVLGFIQRQRIPRPSLQSHPDESDIVRDALLAENRKRILNELATCKPELIVTLGNAALRVLRVLLDWNNVPSKLDKAWYGNHYDVRVNNGRVAKILPLAHPAAPQVYQKSHAEFMQSGRAARLIDRQDIDGI